MRQVFGALCVLLSGVSCLSAADAQPLFESGRITKQTPGHARSFDVDVAKLKRVNLVVTDAGDAYTADWVDWIEPVFVTAGGEVRLGELKPIQATTAWGAIHVNQNADGAPQRVAGKSPAHGIGTHAPSLLTFAVPEGATRLKGAVGLDEGGTSQGGQGSTIEAYVFGDKVPGAVLAQTRINTSAGASHDAADAIANLDVADGLEVALFAAEPLVRNPANIDVDHLGRVWVSEVLNYRRFANAQFKDREEGDRILVLDDSDGDGVADRETVFYQGRDIDSAHGVCVLGSRVIVSAGDSVFVLHDDNGDLKADRKEVLFTGIGGTQHDHGIHAFVFGPDGKLYFNFGNEGHQLKDARGEPVIDLAGNEINDQMHPYQQGMVFRCDLDGSNVETLGWNFRNNWEVCVDAFGTMWQSDNDDDGNRGVRINYVMEFGNYGYRDELTGAGWQTARTNLEPEIPQRHWHLNDPGVVPNLLQTGAGSPTGICIYEGTLLPELFRNQVIHCDAGPNIVRAYPAQADGAGYKAEMVTVLEGTRDNWFRPSDVCVAPDGSLIIADWYDPGVGGHRQGDIDRGRLFRIAPPGVKYSVPKLDLRTPAGAIAGLASPNQATRYLAYQSLHTMGPKILAVARQSLKTETNPRVRARLLGLLKNNQQLLQDTLKDSDPDLRITALRLLRQVLPASGGAKHTETLLNAIETLAHDESAAVRRECALALHMVAYEAKPPGRGVHVSSRKPELWATLASQHVVGDRWSLEALGIGAAHDWDACLEAWLKAFPAAIESDAGRDIVWRSRGQATPALLAKIIAADAVQAAQLPRYLRAFDFLQPDARQATLFELAFETQLPSDKEDFVSFEAINRLPSLATGAQSPQRANIEKMLDKHRGTRRFVTLIERFNLDDRYPELLAMAAGAPDSPDGVAAAKLLLDREQFVLLSEAIQKADNDAAATARVLGNTLDNRTVGLLRPLLRQDEAPLELRQEAVRAMARSKAGAEVLVQLAREGSLANELLPVAAFALHASTDEHIKAAVMDVFPLPPSRNDQPLPPLAELLAMKGNVERGKVVYEGVGKCATCHIVRGAGKEVGPNLSEIGSKLSREAMFESILYPSAGISHNYETWLAETTNGTTVTGILVSQTPEEIVLRGPDAIARTLPRTQLDELIKQPVSLMPADLQKTMTVEELIDVIEYLQTLKKVN